MLQKTGPWHANVIFDRIEHQDLITNVGPNPGLRIIVYFPRRKRGKYTFPIGLTWDHSGSAIGIFDWSFDETEKAGTT